jgi:hypothetical protein
MEGTVIMSIFGDMDVDDIPEDPYYVAPSTYWCLCTEAKFTQFEGNDDTFLSITWTIDEPDNDYHTKNLQELFKVYPGKSKSDLTPKEIQGLSYLKRRLRRGFDLSESEIASVEPSELVSSGAYVTSVVNEGKNDNAGKKFINVKDAVSKRIFDEEASESSNVVSF